MTAPLKAPHRRYNPLSASGCSSRRTARSGPGRGRSRRRPPRRVPGTTRRATSAPATSARRQSATRATPATFVFDNDFAALLPESRHRARRRGRPSGRREPATGRCRVVCFSPRHDLTLAEMDPPDIRAGRRYVGARCRGDRRGPGIGYVQVFENKGAMMGCTNPHPHGQIWATSSCPTSQRGGPTSSERYFERARPRLCSATISERRCEPGSASSDATITGRARAVLGRLALRGDAAARRAACADLPELDRRGARRARRTS